MTVRNRIGFVNDLFFLAVSLSAFLLLNCGPKKGGPPPDWLEQTAPRSDQQYFYGVGCAQYQIDNYFFQRNTARERARVDLAKNIYAFALNELAGDTTASRRVVESTLPSRELAGSYRDEKGNLCARVRVARKIVEEAVNRNRRLIRK